MRGMKSFGRKRGGLLLKVKNILTLLVIVVLAIISGSICGKLLLDNII